VKDSQRVSFKEYKARFEARFGNALELITSESDYVNGRSLVSAKCLIDQNHRPKEKTFHNWLRSNGCQSCGESAGERLVRLVLDQLPVEYEKEKWFATCVDKQPLPFDFFVSSHGFLIEFQGLQHREGF
jgi:hypothetical protein